MKHNTFKANNKHELWGRRWFKIGFVRWRLEKFLLGIFSLGILPFLCFPFQHFFPHCLLLSINMIGVQANVKSLNNLSLLINRRTCVKVNNIYMARGINNK